MNFTKLQDGSYETHIASSDPKKPAYRVIIESNPDYPGGVDIYCGCPGYSHRKKCRHRTLVWDELVERDKKLKESQ